MCRPELIDAATLQKGSAQLQSLQVESDWSVGMEHNPLQRAREHGEMWQLAALLRINDPGILQSLLVVRLGEPAELLRCAYIEVAQHACGLA